jgi:hypothetical protein
MIPGTATPVLVLPRRRSRDSPLVAVCYKRETLDVLLRVGVGVCNRAKRQRGQDDWLGSVSGFSGNRWLRGR